MFASFFIRRPVFAWVIALFITIAGLVAVQKLPVSQYPNVAPPAIQISASYPGASATILNNSVLTVMEEALNGTENMIYMEASADASGAAQITVTFETGTDINSAQVDIQNRLARASSRLPTSVVQQGIRVDKTRSNTLLLVSLLSPDGSYSAEALGDFATRNVVPELLRIQGVGQAFLFGTEQAMRIWVQPDKLVSYGLSINQVNQAIASQNLQIPAGSIGALPVSADQQTFAPVSVSGQLTRIEEFENIILRTEADGSHLRLGDVARLEIGAQQYTRTTRLNGHDALGINIQLAPTGNALETARLIHERMAELQRYFPAGVEYRIPYDTSKFVEISIQGVIKTLIEAIALVFVVMLLFLQNIRYTLIPTIVVPVSLLGTFAVMMVAGYSINMLTLFGMVLAIGILVDDAIIVVENVERLMREEGLGPVEATRKAMHQITGAVIGISAVLISVFVPMALFSGTVGNIYRQFAVAMLACLVISSFLALSLTPALASTLLKPVTRSHEHRHGFFGWFNHYFQRSSRAYERLVGTMLGRSGRYLLLYLAIVGAVVVLYRGLPGAFLPAEDKGYVLVNIQLPPGAAINRTETVISHLEDYVMAQPEVADMVAVLGFSFSGAGQNAGLAFVPLKDWDQRQGDEHSAFALAKRIPQAMADVRDAVIFALNPAPISGLGRSNGFTLQIQDRGDVGYAALLAARNQLLELAKQRPELSNVRADSLEDAPGLQLQVDRERAAALGINFADLASVLSTGLGSRYINDYISHGRLQRVVVQIDAPARMQADDLLRLHVVNNRGEQVPLSAFASLQWQKDPVSLSRYNGYPAMKLTGQAAAGYASGTAMAVMESLIAELPDGIGYEWSSQSREEKLAGSQALVLLGFSLVAVFLCLAALYNSWSIPFAVLLVVPLGIVGALAAVWLRDMPNDVYFKVGLVTVMGLSAKNAILIIEFALHLQAEGKSLLDATIAACHLRFRPILMTSFAFIMGVIPLAFSTGAGSASQRAIGTAVLGGMITATLLAILLVPLLYVVVRRLTRSGQAGG